MKKEYIIINEPVIPGYYTHAIWQDEKLDSKRKVIQERKLLKESEFIQTGEPKDKWNIYYFHDGLFTGDKQCYSSDGKPGEIKDGYTENNELKINQ